MSKKSFIDSVRVGSVCNEKWEEMRGNDRVRFCSHCSKNVNNLSTMTRKEATRLVRASDGNICIRYIVDPVTRRPIFAEQLLQITRRAPGIAAGALTASIAVSTASYGQETRPQPAPTPPTVSQSNTDSSINDVVITSRQIDELPIAARPVAFGGVVASVEYRSALSRAISDQDKDLIRELIAKGEDVNAKEGSYSKITPFFLAVETGDVEIVQMLIDAGAKVNARSATKETPLMRLDSDGSRALVELLIRNGAKVNVADKSGNTPLIMAAQNSTSDTIAALIDAGADVNAANEDGDTALIKAADRGDIQSVRALLFAGAMVNARNKDGENAWDKTSDQEIEDLLVSFGSEVSETVAEPSPAPTPEATPPDR